VIVDYLADYGDAGESVTNPHSFRVEGFPLLKRRRGRQKAGGKDKESKRAILNQWWIVDMVIRAG